ncbi:MAG: hypothetical protein ACFE0Q_20870 [Anaerolineae bacterium]
MSQFMIEHRLFIVLSFIVWGASYLMYPVAPLLAIVLSLVTLACWGIVLTDHFIRRIAE